MDSWFCYANDFMHIAVKAFPSSAKNEMAGIRDNHLCIRIAAKAEDGKANACLCGFLAKVLGCAKRDVRITKGEKSRLKTVAIPAAYSEKLKTAVLAQ
jgi:uncharacterized protein (TIGR00251 family)